MFKENYKIELDNLVASEEFKNKTILLLEQNTSKPKTIKVNFKKQLMAVASVAVCFILVYFNMFNNKLEVIDIPMQEMKPKVSSRAMMAQEIEFSYVRVSDTEKEIFLKYPIIDIETAENNIQEYFSNQEIGEIIGSSQYMLVLPKDDIIYEIPAYSFLDKNGKEYLVPAIEKKYINITE